MPKKQFEDTPYNPIAVDLAREVGRSGRVGVAVPPAKVTPQPIPFQTPASEASKADPLSRCPRLVARVRNPCVTKRFVLTRKEDDDLNAFVLRLQTQAGTKVTLSVLVRAAVTVMMQAEEQIVEEIGERFPQEYPSTHDTISMGEFEERWTRHLVRALRRLPSVQKLVVTRRLHEA
jgi:hypothetical protein